MADRRNGDGSPGSDEEDGTVVDFCPFCGKRVFNFDAVFCYRCGEKLPRFSNGAPPHKHHVAARRKLEADAGFCCDHMRRFFPNLWDFLKSLIGPTFVDQTKKMPYVPVNLEVALRITASSFVGYVLGIAAPPAIIPSSYASMVGFFPATIVTQFPMFLMALGMAIPAVMFVMITALTGATLVLTAGWVSTGLYIFIYAVFALMISTLRFQKGLGSMVGVIVLCTLTISSGMLPIVQNGIGGEDGGLVWISRFWTSSGLQNPLAIFQNFLIAFCWILLIVAIAPLIYPWRTARKAISRGLFPVILKECASGIRNVMIDDDGNVEAEANGSEGNSRAVNARLLQYGNTLIGGTMAGLTAYEPRLFRCKPPECSFLVLKKLSNSILDVVVSTLALHALPAGTIAYDGAKDMRVHVADDLDLCAKSLAGGISLEEAAAKSLDVKSGASTGAVAGKTAADGTETQRKFGNIEDVDSNVSNCNHGAKRHPTGLDSAAISVHNYTREWLAVMDTPGTEESDYAPTSWCSKASWQNIHIGLKLWYMPIIGMTKQVLGPFIQMFIPKYWRPIILPPREKLPEFWWSVKFAAGFTALLCMDEYWEAFYSYRVPTRDDVTSTHYPGWVIIAYAFATTQTLEGSVKKGILRLFGTCLGGFSAWLGLLACDDSNPYGLVAWLTVTTFLVSYLGSDARGPAAYMGLSKDYGFFNIYTIMTQAIIVFDVYYGGNRNDLTANRIVGNITGILMSSILAAVPPTIQGNDPQHTRKLNNIVKRHLVQCLWGVLQRDAECLQESQEQLRKQGMEQVKKATDFLKDSSRLKICPFYRPDPSLNGTLNAVSMTGTLLHVMHSLASDVVRDESWVEAFDEHGGRLRFQVMKILENLENPNCDEQAGAATAKDVDEQKIEGGNIVASQMALPDLFMQYVDIALNKINQNEANLSKVRWGFSTGF